VQLAEALLGRVERLAAAASEKGVRLMIDAEHTYFQPVSSASRRPHAWQSALACHALLASVGCLLLCLGTSALCGNRSCVLLLRSKKATSPGVSSPHTCAAAHPCNLLPTQAIDHTTQVLSLKHNRRAPVIFNTYQAYLKDSHTRLLEDMERARREGYTFAAKLVRSGAGARRVAAFVRALCLQPDRDRTCGTFAAPVPCAQGSTVSSQRAAPLDSVPCAVAAALTVFVVPVCVCVRRCVVRMSSWSVRVQLSWGTRTPSGQTSTQHTPTSTAASTQSWMR
jgi:hypothetical protein